MDENDPTSSDPSSANDGSGKKLESTDANMEDRTETNVPNIEEKLALLQEIYQRKQTELLMQFQQNQEGQSLGVNEYLLLLQNAAAAAASTMPTGEIGSLNLQQQQTIPAALTNAQINKANNPQPIPHPLLRQLRQASSEQSTDTENMDISGPPHSAGLIAPSTPSVLGGGGSSASGLRNRRTLSGSGQTISQHTRDRLKTMIATKKQKQRLHSSCSTGSTSNIAWLPPSQSELSFFGTSTTVGGGITVPNSSTISASNTSNHFEPYPQLTHRSNTHSAGSREQPPASRKGTSNTVAPVMENLDNQSAEFQLRKVNSEPNLKMRIRARLLNKGASPQQTNNSSVKQSTNIKSELLSNDMSVSSDDASTRTALLLCALAQKQQEQQAALTTAIANSRMQAIVQQQIGGNLIMPSPSLPNLLLMGKTGGGGYPQTGAEKDGILSVENLPAGLGGSQQSLSATEASMTTNLLMQMQLASYLSMPSLLNTGPFNALSMFRHDQEQQQQQNNDLASNLGSSSSLGSTNANTEQQTFNRNKVRFDTTRTPLPIAGGYPSLLKQQLRDLVLRRKSLVREEPEEEQAMEVFSMSKRQQQQVAAAGSPSSIATGISGNPFFSQLKTGLAYDQVMAKHQCMCADSRNHVEHGGRVQSIWARLQEKGLVDLCDRVASRKAPPELLQLVHSAPYVAFFAVSPTRWLLRMESPQPMNLLTCGGIGVDLDTYFNFYDENVQHAICVAAGLLVELSCQVAEGKLRNGFACIRPPGHHAEREQAMSTYIIIAARFLQQRFSSNCGSRIAIIDWDVHHGNGTQLCFEADPNVLYVSLHRHDNGNFFPGTGAVTDVGIDSGRHFSVNIPFSGEMMGDAEYLAAWRVIVLPLLDSFRPEFILVSSGFDGARGHSNALGGYNLSPRLFSYFTRTLMSFANGRVVMALEGGYELSVISECAEECVRALCAKGSQVETILPPPEELDKIPNQSAQETMQKVIAVHKRHWPCLTGIQGINTSELHWQTISQRFSTLTVHSS